MNDYKGPSVGVAYYRPPSPPSAEWEEDFKRIKEMGFEAVKIWVYWGWHERKEGEFDWRESDLFFDLAEKNNLCVTPQILLELPPSWLEIKHVLQTPEGPVCKSHFPSLHIPCFDDQNLRRAAEPFIKKLTHRYKDRSILHWDVWNEPRSRWDCVCQASRESYQRWLKQKYHTVEDYNRIFGKCFHSWEAVSKYIGESDFADEFNWRLWAAHRLADQVHWVAEIVRNIDPHHPVMAHVGACSPIQNVRKDTCVDAIMTKGLDFYGSSYDASWESQVYTTDAGNIQGLEDQSNLTRAKIQVDWLRSLSPKNWICELYGDHHSMWTTRKPATLMWQFWQAVSRGLAGIMVWEYKVERIGIESWGYGLVGLDGQPNNRSKALSRAFYMIKNELADLFTSFEYADPEVGILYDERSYLLSAIERRGCPSNIHFTSAWSLYEVLRRKNIPVRWVPRQDIDNVLSGMKTLFLPGHGFMDEELAEKLKSFVENGGNLFAQAGTGFRAANTWVSPVIPSYGLDTVFGVREISREMADGAVNLLDAGHQVIDRLSTFKVNLECSGAKPVLYFEDGNPALATNQYGRGTTWYFGGFLGFDCNDTGGVLSTVLGDQTDPFIQECSGLGLDVIPWQSKRGPNTMKAYFVFNTTDQGINFKKPEGMTTCTELFGTVKLKEETVSLGANSAALLW